MKVAELVKVFSPEYGYIFLKEGERTIYWYTALEQGFSLDYLLSREITEINAKFDYDCNCPAMLISVKNLFNHKT